MIENHNKAAAVFKIAYLNYLCELKVISLR